MVPVAGLPPGMPLTLQEMLVSVAPVTVAVKVCALPKSNEAVAGITVTLMEEGGWIGGGGWTTAETPPPQPTVHAAVARRTRIGNAGKRGCDAGEETVTAFCERGRMLRRNAGEGPGSRAGARSQ